MRIKPGAQRGVKCGINELLVSDVGSIEIRELRQSSIGKSLATTDRGGPL